MVKGISRQVILVNSPDPALFDQAIFILKEGQTGLTDEVLLKEASRIVSSSQRKKPAATLLYTLLGGILGATCTGVIWLLTAMIL